MEGLDDLYIKLQVFLMRKDKECGKLRFLTSRTTAENSNHVEDVCVSIRETLQSCGIPIEEDATTSDPKCVRAYKYLLLNTHFECQLCMAEDLLNGHLADMCPPLSPYLLVEILWSIGYESIVAESLLHVPIDLCVEIIDISRRCAGLLDFHRCLDFVADLTLNCCKKLHLMVKTGTQTTKLDESLELMFANLQELIVLVTSARVTRLDEVTKLRKSERLGLILKKTLWLMRNCLECGKNGVELSSKMASMYAITFGNEQPKRLDENFANQLRVIDQEFVNMSMKIMKEIVLGTYVDWATLEAGGSSSTSLQQSIGNDCYDVIEFMKSYDHLPQCDHFVEILRQISSKPEKETIGDERNLAALVEGASNGRRECAKELLRRYDEWNHETFEAVRRNKLILDKEDFLHLLEYLTLVMTKSGQEEHKRRVYDTVTRVLMQQSISDVYETTLEYVLRHDGRNILETSNTEKSFNEFMAHNTNFKSPRNLRILLLFLLKNPRKIMKILVRMSIGDGNYENVMVSPEDMMLLSPLMSIRVERDDTLFLGALRGVCSESVEWNAKKFGELVRVTLENCLFTADKIVNNVFVPCLDEKTVRLSNVKSILNCLRKIAPACTEETHLDRLLETLGRGMARIRNDNLLPKYSGNEALSMITRVVEIFLRKIDDWLDAEKTDSLMERMNNILAPIDKPYFAKLLLSDCCGKIDVFDTIRDYERRCYIVMNRVMANRQNDNDDESKIILNDMCRFDDDFLRYIIVKSTETEYAKLAIQATIFHVDDFGCENEYETYEKIVRVTAEAAVYCLEFPARNPPDSFACLMKGLALFTSSVSRCHEVRNTDKIHTSLIDGVRGLEKFIRNTIFSSAYTTVILLINNRSNHEPAEASLRELIQSIHDFGSKCIEIARSEAHFERKSSIESTRYRIAHDFITECMSVNDDGSYQSLCHIYNLLCSNDTQSDLS